MIVKFKKLRKKKCDYTKWANNCLLVLPKHKLFYKVRRTIIRFFFQSIFSSKSFRIFQFLNILNLFFQIILVFSREGQIFDNFGHNFCYCKILKESLQDASCFLVKKTKTNGCIRFVLNTNFFPQWNEKNYFLSLQVFLEKHNFFLFEIQVQVTITK